MKCSCVDVSEPPHGTASEPGTCRALKRLLDRAAAFMLIVLLSPLALLIAMLIIADTGLPVFYRQVRVGHRGRPFLMYKFRTMVQNAETMEGGLDLSSDDSRITRVGRYLRALSIDEWPQLLNMVLGNMSFVGPRPGLPDQVERYTTRQLRRLEVRPGLTGWAQIHGRNALSWNERIEYDIWYIDHWSLWLDLRIVARTPRAVFSGQGVYGVDGRNPDVGE